MGRSRTDMNYKWDELATYNAEEARGIMHRSAYMRRMMALQDAFDAEHRTLMTAQGWTESEDGSFWRCFTKDEAKDFTVHRPSLLVRLLHKLLDQLQHEGLSDHHGRDGFDPGDWPRP